MRSFENFYLLSNHIEPNIAENDEIPIPTAMMDDAAKFYRFCPDYYEGKIECDNEDTSTTYTHSRGTPSQSSQRGNGYSTRHSRSEVVQPRQREQSKGNGEKVAKIVGKTALAIGTGGLSLLIEGLLSKK